MEVNVTKRIETSTGSRYCPVVVNTSGRIKADWVIVNGEQEKHAEGSYYLEWRENGQRRRLSVGKDAVVAFNSQVRKVKELEARAEGLLVELPKDDPNRAQLRSAMTDFLKEIKLSRKDKTWRGYGTPLDHFGAPIPLKTLPAIQTEPTDLTEFAAAYYAGDRGIAREQLNYHNPDVVAYVEAVRRRYLLRKYPAARLSRRFTP
jgi:hypothetical protein